MSSKDDVFAPIIKSTIEEALEQQLQEHLAQSEIKNRKNGSLSKTVKTAYGNIAIESSRNRLSTYHPQFLATRQTTLGKSLDRKIISLYANGMSQSSIADHIQELYGMDVSKSLVSNITDSIIVKAIV